MKPEECSRECEVGNVEQEVVQLTFMYCQTYSFGQTEMKRPGCPQCKLTLPENLLCLSKWVAGSDAWALLLNAAGLLY